MNEQLAALVQQVQQGKQSCDLASLRRVIDDTFNQLSARPELFIDMLFLQEIHDCLSPHSERIEHLYMRHFDVPQIVLYDTLINQFPFVRCSHQITNQVLLTTLCRSSHSVLIDIGVGRGVQIAQLIRSLPLDSGLRQLTVIGVEPFDEALCQAKEQILDAARSAPCEVQFIPVQSFIEHLSLADLQRVMPQDAGSLAINAAFTLHHIASAAERLAVLEMLHRLKPCSLVLAEPDTDHLTSDWQTRMSNAYRHYGAVFALIRELRIGESEKKALKAFFRREISDVASLNDDERFERHEPCQKWLEYLEAAGFTLAERIPVQLGAADWPRIEFMQRVDGCLNMSYDATDLLTLIHATPRQIV